MMKELEFIRMLDDLKGIKRAAYVLAGERNENSAEHSWHVTVSALMMQKYAPAGIDTLRVLKMLLIHDIVEIQAGDTILFDEEGMKSKVEREALAAEDLFGRLPLDMGGELHQIWEEFENGNSPEALYANAIDRLLPILLNINCEGKAWKEHNVKKSALIAKSQQIKEVSEDLWKEVLNLIDIGVREGWLIE